MSKKASNISMLTALCELTEPVLVSYYTAAIRAVCKTWVRVPKSAHSTFTDLRKWLDENDISYSDYITFVVKTWWDWCKEQRIKTVPIGIVCGPKAKEQYLKRLHESSVRIDTPLDDIRFELMYVEIMAAKLFLHGDIAVGMSRIRDDLARMVLGRTYIPNEDIIDEVSQLLNAHYGIVAADYYKDNCISSGKRVL